MTPINRKLIEKDNLYLKEIKIAEILSQDTQGLVEIFSHIHTNLFFYPNSKEAYLKLSSLLSKELDKRIDLHQPIQIETITKGNTSVKTSTPLHILAQYDKKLFIKKLKNYDKKNFEAVDSSDLGPCYYFFQNTTESEPVFLKQLEAIFSKGVDVNIYHPQSRKYDFDTIGKSISAIIKLDTCKDQNIVDDKVYVISQKIFEILQKNNVKLNSGPAIWQMISAHKENSYFDWYFENHFEDAHRVFSRMLSFLQNKSTELDKTKLMQNMLVQKEKDYFAKNTINSLNNKLKTL